MDSWKATRKAWKTLFPAIVIICCFLHVFIKIRDRAKKKYRDIYENVASKLWECYRAESKMSFSQRIRRLVEWCEDNDVPPVIVDPIKKLRKNIAVYRVAYDHPKAHRTSNMVDRLMQRMDRHLYSTQYFHGSMDAAQLSIRGWTLINNFAPYNPRTVKILNGYKSPAERLNQFRDITIAGYTTYTFRLLWVGVGALPKIRYNQNFFKCRLSRKSPEPLAYTWLQ
jgi:hypothetical protein